MGRRGFGQAPLRKRIDGGSLESLILIPVVFIIILGSLISSVGAIENNITTIEPERAILLNNLPEALQTEPTLPLVNETDTEAKLNVSNDDQKIERGLDWVDIPNSDGSRTRIIHTNPINYYNGSEYVPIDPTIIKSEDGYEVTKGPYKAYWGENAEVRVESDGFYLAYSEKNLTNGAQTEEPKYPVGNPNVDKNKITYAEFYPGMDLEYSYFPHLLKQNFIINSFKPESPKSEFLEFARELDYSPELEMWVESDAPPVTSIEFRHQGETVFYIPPPLVSDSNESTIVGEFELRETGSKTLLVLKVPVKWLEDPARVYPIKVDPSIKKFTLADAFVNENPLYDDTNYGSEKRLRVRSWKVGDIRTLLKFNLKSSSIEKDWIYSIRLKMYSYSAKTGRTVKVYYSDDDNWYESSVTWNNRPLYDAYWAQSSSGTGWKTWYITSKAKPKWGEKITLILKDKSEGSTLPKNQYYRSWEYWYYNNIDKDPRIEIWYTEPVVDDEDPTVSVSGAPSDWQNSDASASVSCSDNDACDVNTYKLKIYTSKPSSCPTTYSSYTKSSPQTISAVRWVCAAAKDTSGNIGFSSSPVKFKVDKTTPTYKSYSVSGCDYKDSTNKVCWVKPGTTTYHTIRHYDSKSTPYIQYLTFTKDGCTPNSCSSGKEVKSYVYVDSDSFHDWMTNNNYLDIQGTECVESGGCTGTYAKEKWTVNTGTSGGNFKVWTYLYDQAWNGQGYDYVGWWYKVDKTAPNNPTSVTSTSHSTSTWNSDNTIDVSWSGASDTGSGVYGYSYVFDTSPTTLPDKTVDITGTTATSESLSDGSSWYFHIRTKDKVGNWKSTAVHLGPFYIDATPPSTPSSITWDDGATSDDTTIVANWGSVTDTSGVVDYYLQVDVDSTDFTSGLIFDGLIGSSSSKKTLTSSDGVASGHTYYYRVKAKNGADLLSSSWSSISPGVNVQADSDPPTTTIYLSGTLGDNDWYKSDVDVTLECDDGTSGSGCQIPKYCVDYYDSCNPTTQSSAFTLTGEGIRYVRYYSTDNAGNPESLKSEQVKIDKTPPDTYIETGPDATETRTDATFTFTTQPYESGARFYYELDGSPSGWTTSTSVTYTDLPPGDYVFKVKSKDKAGNVDLTPDVWTWKIIETGEATFEYEIVNLGSQVGVLDNRYQIPSGGNGFTITVKNFGDSLAEDINVDVSIIGLDVPIIKPQYVFPLDADEEETVGFGVELADGRYDILISLGYKDSDYNMYDKEIKAHLLVGDIPTVDIPDDEYLVINTASIKDGLNYLVSTQNVEGSWGENGGDALTTSIVADVLQTSSDESESVNNALDYLESDFSEEQNSVELVARAGLLFTRAGRTDRVQEALDFLNLVQNDDDGWGHETGYRSDPLDTLLVAKLHGESIWLAEQESVQRIFDEEDVFVTSEVGRAIAYTVDTSETVEYLKTQEGLTLLEKASFLSLLSRVDDLDYAQGVAEELLASQGVDGSFGGPVKTAYAVRALSEYFSVASDLAVYPEDITFSEERPTYGDEVEITAVIRNLGYVNVENTTVAFFDGETSLGEANISVEASKNSTASVSWNTTPGYHTITVIVDPENKVIEANESNNNASTVIFVNSPPVVELLYPIGGEYLAGNVTVEWDASDPDGDELYSWLSISEAVGGLWENIATGLVNATSYSWDTSFVEDREYYFMVNVSDGLAVRGEVSNSSFLVDNTPPVINVSSPIDRNYSYTEDLLIDFNAIDTGSGITSLGAVLDIASVVDGDVVDLFDFALGAHIFRVKAVDRAGNNATVEVTFNVIDDIPPVSSDDSDKEWHTADITTTLTSNDEKSSVAEVHYIINEDPEVLATADADGIVGDPFTAMLLIDYEDDNNTIEYWAVDEWGNAEEHRFVDGIKLDKTKPETTDDYDGLWHTQDFTINLDAVDPTVQGNPSGIAETYYIIYKDGVGQGVKRVSADGQPVIDYEDDDNWLEYWSIDKAGNIETKAMRKGIKLDKTQPTTTDDYDGQWHTVDVTVTLTAADPTVQGVPSGVAETYYIIYHDGVGQGTKALSTDGQPVITYEDDDNWLEYWSVDVAGNWEEHATIKEIKLDKTNPITGDDYDGKWHTGDITITLTAIDPVVQGSPSGVAETYYIIYEDEVPQGTKTLSIDGQPIITYEDDDNWLEYWSVDVAGNEEEHITVKEIKLDKTPPVVSLTLEPKDTYYNDEPLPVTYDAYDPIVQGTPSNEVTLAFDIDGTPVEDPTDVRCRVGTHTLTATATDLAGNSASASVTFTVVLRTDLNIDPDTLNLYSNGNWITAYIEVPAGGCYDVMTIDVNTLLINDIVPAETNPKYDFVSNPQPADEDGDGVPEFMAKFSRDMLREILEPADEVTLTVTGAIPEGDFEGSDTISVIANGNNKTKDKTSLKVDKKVKAVEIDGERDKSMAEVNIDLIALGNQPVKAVLVKEYVPEELTVNTNDGIFTGFGLMWQVGTVDKKETLKYILTLPEVTETKTYELKTVVEYQTAEDLETLEKTSILTINPKGQAKLSRGNESKNVKAKGKGYSKVQWALPNSKGGSDNSKGKKKGHDKDKGKPDKPGKPENPGKPDKPPKDKDSGTPDEPENSPDELDDSPDDDNPSENPGNGGGNNGGDKGNGNAGGNDNGGGNGNGNGDGNDGDNGKNGKSGGN